MSSFVIACPNPVCGRPLNLPAEAVGKPLSCPHCGIGISIALGPDGQPRPPTAIPTSRRVPKLFMVPGFALVILGLGGVFGNGYIAVDVFTRPGAAAEYARKMVDYARDVSKRRSQPTRTAGRARPTRGRRSRR